MTGKKKSANFGKKRYSPPLGQTFAASNFIQCSMKTTPTYQLPLLDYEDFVHAASLPPLMEAGLTKGCGREASC